ncbi:MAG TPA: tripartite tricarboxylate transporter substrate binding protein [Xanthobacteraceae bacterium]|jgi:putative tricarboxylic transport membrane protein|nr:tripartite tricarboxylate transporter substrate binding protein [Xanthobacteraceae bacterium]
MNGKPRIHRRGFLRNVGSAAIGVAASASPLRSTSRAQERFPAREISWIIYQAPGGSIDTTARIIQPYLEKNGVKTNLDYVLGAGGRVARTKLHTARPDGYLMMTESAPGGAIDEVIGRAGYKASDFIAIYGWSVVSWQLCVKKDSPIQTFQQFVEECKKRRVVVGTIGRSGSSHIQLAALQKELNLPFGMVHFEGSGKAYPAVMGGHVDAAISGPGSGSRMRESLHFLAVTGEEREKALPEVPTLTELGFRVTPIDQIWYAMATPKVPDDRIAMLSSAFAKAFEDKALWEQMQKAGEYLKLLTRPQVEAMVGKQAEVIEKYKDLLG